MTNRYMKRYSILLIIGEMQIKTTHVTRVLIKKMRDNCWEECGENGTLLHYWHKYKFVQPLRKTARRFLKILKIELPYGLAIPLLGIYSKELKLLSQRDSVSHVYCSFIYNSQNRETIEISIYVPVHTQTHNRILCSHNKEGNPAIWDNIDRP